MNQIARTGARDGVSAKPLRQVTSVRELLVNDQAKQQLAAVAAHHMRPEQMLRLMANAIRTTPQLGECDPLSLLGGMMTCASLGLTPNTPLQHAYLLPFKNSRKNITEVQLVIGYRGMIDLARRSGHIVSIHGDVVYEGDEFSFEYGSEQHLKHRPKGKRTNPIYAYCHAKLTDGEAFVVWPYEQVLAIRDASQGYKTAIKYGKKDTPWIAHEHEMAAKTMVRALFKYLPISIEIDGGNLGNALIADDQHIDYSQFAKNPEDGLTVEGEIVDQETGEVRQVEDQRAGQMTMDQEPERESTPAQRPRSNTKAADHTDPKPHDQRQQRGNARGQEKAPQGGLDLSNGAPSLSSRIKMLSQSIIDNLQDGADLEGTLDLFDAQLEQIKAEAPDEHAAMLDDFADFVKQRDA